MQTLTETQLAHLKRGGIIAYEMTVAPVAGEPFTLSEADLIEDSLELDRGQWTTNDTVQIGNADAAELVFMLDNSDARWNAVKFESSDIVLDWVIAGETLRAGRFVVYKQEWGYDTIVVYAMDYMSKLDKEYDGDLAFPATLLQILQYCATKAGLTLSTETFMNSDLSVPKEPEAGGMTYRHLVGWVAQLAACNAWADGDGHLHISWYGDDTSTATVNLDMMLQWVIYDESERVVTGVEYSDAEQTYAVGTKDYLVSFVANPLLQSDHAAVVLSIFNKVNTLTFLPVSSLPTVFLPHIWPGDTLRVEALNMGEGETEGSYYLANVLVGKHHLSTNSEITGTGVAAPVTTLPKFALSGAQRNEVETIARTTPAQDVNIATTIEETVIDYTGLAAGSVATFYEQAMVYCAVAAMNDSQAIVAFADIEGTYYLMAALANISGSTVTLEPPVAHVMEYVSDVKIAKLDATHAIISYKQGDAGRAVIVTLDGSTLTFGTAVAFELDRADQPVICRMDDTHALVAYRNNSFDGDGLARVLTVSGTTITVGPPVTFNAGNTYDMSVAAFDPVTAIITFEDGGNSYYGTAVIASRSDSTLTIGDEAVFNVAVTAYTSVATVDSTRAVIAFMDGAVSNRGSAIVATASGTSISFGTKVGYSLGAAYNNSVCVLDDTHIVVGYHGGPPVVIPATLDGTALEFGDYTVVGSATGKSTVLSWLDATNMILVFIDTDDSSHGRACVISAATTTTSYPVTIDTVTAGGGLLIKVGDTNVIGFTAKDVYIRFPGGSPDNRFGCDATGPYYVKAGAKTYF